MVRTPRLGGLTDWRPLARGGFAVVWEAHQQSLDRQVAVKIITRKLDNPEERERFLRESSAAGRMSSHPGIVTVHDAGLLDDDRPYLVMELCTGGSLTRRLAPEDRQSPEWVRDLGVRIADALAAAHAQGVLHRDVKPANVLIDRYGHAGLADFGLAVMTDGMDLEERLEALTPAYAPPEAFAPHTPTASGDVYSLAATLYALLGGHAPRAVDPGDAEPDLTAAQVVMAHLDDPVERLPDVDPRLMDVLMAALDDDPAARPTAAAFRDALAALPLGAPAVPVLPQLDEPVAAPPEPQAPGAPGDAGRRSRTEPASLAPPRDGGGLRRARARGRARRGALGPPRHRRGATRDHELGTGAVVDGHAGCGRARRVHRLQRLRRTPGAVRPQHPQCWGQLLSVADSPNVATSVACDKTHVYQTFAAGPLTTPALRQSQLDADPAAKAICTSRLVNAMLPADQRRGNWEIFTIPPQSASDDESYFRCVFGRGERAAPLKLGAPA